MLSAKYVFENFPVLWKGMTESTETICVSWCDSMYFIFIFFFKGERKKIQITFQATLLGA